MALALVAHVESAHETDIRRAYDHTRGGLTEWPVYDRYALQPGMTVDGPALIEERESTCVVGAGNSVTVDARYNLVAELGG